MLAVLGSSLLTASVFVVKMTIHNPLPDRQDIVQYHPMMLSNCPF